MWVVNEYFGSFPRQDRDGGEEGESIFGLARVGVGVVTVGRGLNDQETRGFCSTQGTLTDKKRW